jgi:hypothetical protein
VRNFTAFLGRSPDTAASDDLRRFQLHMAQQQVGPWSPSTRSATSRARSSGWASTSRADRRPADPGRHGAAPPGGRRRLSRPWGGVAQGERRACKPHPIEGHVGDRDLSHCRARRPRRAVRGLRARADRLQLLPQSALPEVSGRGGAPMARTELLRVP